ncbi:MAG: adenosylcobinamide-GDP ribazoletransferase [Hyphomicrobiaceae bacterium]
MNWLAFARQEAAYAIVAVQFLTRLPVPVMRSFNSTWMDRSIAYFPLTGLIVGGICSVVWLASNHIWTPAISAILALAAGIAATGAFHEDGLADTADGLGGGLTREKRLLIMKDSRIGTYGTVVLITALALKVACLSVMSPWSGAVALLAAHCCGRIVPVVASRIVPYAGEAEGSKVAPMMPTNRRLAFAVATGLTPALLIPAVPMVAALAAGTVASWWLLAKASKLIGGQTGDVLGASEQVFEVAVLLVLAGFAP